MSSSPISNSTPHQSQNNTNNSNNNTTTSSSSSSTTPTNSTTTETDILQKVNNMASRSSSRIAAKIPLRTINPEIYFYNKGFRFPYPYYHDFTTHTKGRWIGRMLPEIFAREFTQYTEDQIKESMRKGRLKVNNRIAPPDQRLLNGDLIVHQTHRHELPVTDDPIDFIKVEDDFFIVDKPASIPVHPCGHYRRGSLTHILNYEYGMDEKNLFPVHRLDRLTSGLLIIAKNQKMASTLADQIKSHGDVKKCYLAKVRGKFPHHSSAPVTRVDGNLDLVDKRVRNKWTLVEKGRGKPCRTLFTLVHYNEDTDESIVMCSPITGRTHQIRVHLQHAGYPISNDPCYGPEERRREFNDRFEYFLSEEQKKIFDQEKQQYLESQKEQPRKRQRMSDDATQQSVDRSHPPSARDILVRYPDQTMKETHKEWQYDASHIDPDCPDCKLIIFPRTESDYRIYLHSLGYDMDDMKVFTKIPAWASEVTQDEVDASWKRLKSWTDDNTSYTEEITKHKDKKKWKRRSR